MFLKNQTIIELLNENYTFQEFYNVFDETIYQTKNFDIIAALGMVKACFKENGHTNYIPKSVYETSKKLGPIPIYTSENLDDIYTSDSEGSEDSMDMDIDLESQECFVSDCESCETECTEAESIKSFRNFKPSWMLNDTPRVISASFQKQLDVATDLKECVFCITGLLDKFSRDQLCYFIKLKNGIVSDNLTKSVDFLIVGSNPGKTKLNLAKKYNTKTLSEEDIIILLTRSQYSVFLQELHGKLNQIKTGLERQEEAKSAFETVKTELKNTVLPQIETLDWSMDWSILDNVVPPPPNTPTSQNFYVNRIV